MVTVSPTSYTMKHMPPQGGHILVVDDDFLNRALLTMQLEADGFTIATAENGRMALEQLAEGRFDLVLLDLIMPEMDGFEVLEQLQASSALLRLPVIVISALEQMESVVRCIEMGATDYLPKPFDPILLRARVNASLADKRLRDQEAEYLRQVAYLTSAATEVEAGRFDPASLAAIAGRSDELGKLAQVFQQMAREVQARERQLTQQNHFKTALIGKITHELRSPFVAAGFSVQLMGRYAEYSMMDELREQIHQLERQLNEGRQMIDGIISFAALMSKRTVLHIEPTDIAHLIQETAVPLQKMAATRSVQVLYQLADPLPPVHVDRDQLAEAIHHLIHNAIKFNREGGSVRIFCQASNAQLLFSVEDTGQGISAEKIAVIWQAFEQTADDVQRGVEGLGLGLALVKYVVEAHRGEVVARSKPGVGSLFGFRIPLGG